MNQFKLVIAGGRDFNNFTLLHVVLDNLLQNQTDITIISGGAKGADSLGARYAALRGYPLITMNADWDRHGKSAGYKRNIEMSKASDAAVCFWDGKSRGTKHIIDITEKADKPLRIIRY